MAKKQQSQDSQEVLDEIKIRQETKETKDKLRENFKKSKNFEYLTSVLEPTKDSEKIIDKIETSYETLKTSSLKLENTKKNLSSLYKISEDISVKELAIIDAVENKIGKYLKPKDKLELIRLLSGIEINLLKQDNDSKVIETSKYSKEMLNHPQISIVEGLFLDGAIKKEVFLEFIKNTNFNEALEKFPEIKNNLEKIEKNQTKIDFLEIYGSYIPEAIKESFIIKQIEKNFVGRVDINSSNAKEYNLFISLEKTLNETLKNHKYFYKPDTYYDALEYIRKTPEKTETIGDFFELKLRALAYVMELATGKNPFRIEEKNLKAGEQAKAVEQKEEKIEKKDLKNPIYEKILSLIEKNEKLGEEKIFKQREKLKEIKQFEKKDVTNNPFYTKNNMDILPEKDEAA